MSTVPIQTVNSAVTLLSQTCSFREWKHENCDVLVPFFVIEAFRLDFSNTD